MGRYKVLRSPYPDEVQARAIELLREAESGKFRADFIVNTLAEEFPGLNKLQDRFRSGNPTLKIIRRWAKSRPNLPELLKGERVRTFEQVAFEETVREMSRQAVFLTMKETFSFLATGNM